MLSEGNGPDLAPVEPQYHPRAGALVENAMRAQESVNCDVRAGLLDDRQPLVANGVRDDPAPVEMIELGDAVDVPHFGRPNVLNFVQKGRSEGMASVKGKAINRPGAFAERCGYIAQPSRYRVGECTLRAVYLACQRWLRSRGLDA